MRDDAPWLYDQYLKVWQRQVDHFTAVIWEEYRGAWRTLVIGEHEAMWGYTYRTAELARLWCDAYLEQLVAAERLKERDTGT